MKVSKLSAFLFLSIIFAICLALSPVFAGEHPWDENKKGGTASDSTTINPNIDPHVGTDPGNAGGMSGTAVFWWHFIYESVYSGKSSATAPAAKVGNENGGTLNQAAAIR